MAPSKIKILFLAMSVILLIFGQKKISFLGKRLKFVKNLSLILIFKSGFSTFLFGVAKVSKGLFPPPFLISNKRTIAQI